MFFYIQIEVEEGSLVCPESGKKFPIKNGIPNMLLNEDEVWICPKLELIWRFKEWMYSEWTIMSCAIRSLWLNFNNGWLGLWAAVSGWRYPGSLFSAGQQLDSWTWQHCTPVKLCTCWTRVALNLLLFLMTFGCHSVRCILYVKSYSNINASQWCSSAIFQQWHCF